MNKCSLAEKNSIQVKSDTLDEIQLILEGLLKEKEN